MNKITNNENFKFLITKHDDLVLIKTLYANENALSLLDESVSSIVRQMQFQHHSHSEWALSPYIVFTTEDVSSFVPSILFSTRHIFTVEKNEANSFYDFVLQLFQDEGSLSDNDFDINVIASGCFYSPEIVNHVVESLNRTFVEKMDKDVNFQNEKFEMKLFYAHTGCSIQFDPTCGIMPLDYSACMGDLNSYVCDIISLLSSENATTRADVFSAFSTEMLSDLISVISLYPMSRTVFFKYLSVLFSQRSKKTCFVNSSRSIPSQFSRWIIEKELVETSLAERVLTNYYLDSLLKHPEILSCKESIQSVFGIYGKFSIWEYHGLLSSDENILLEKSKSLLKILFNHPLVERKLLTNADIFLGVFHMLIRNVLVEIPSYEDFVFSIIQDLTSIAEKHEIKISNLFFENRSRPWCLAELSYEDLFIYGESFAEKLIATFSLENVQYAVSKLPYISQHVDTSQVFQIPLVMAFLKEYDSVLYTHQRNNFFRKSKGRGRDISRLLSTYSSTGRYFVSKGHFYLFDDIDFVSGVKKDPNQIILLVKAICSDVDIHKNKSVVESFKKMSPSRTMDFLTPLFEDFVLDLKNCQKQGYSKENIRPYMVFIHSIMEKMIGHLDEVTFDVSPEYIRLTYETLDLLSARNLSNDEFLSSTLSSILQISMKLNPCMFGMVSITSKYSERINQALSEMDYTFNPNQMIQSHCLLFSTYLLERWLSEEISFENIFDFISQTSISKETFEKWLIFSLRNYRFTKEFSRQFLYKFELIYSNPFFEKFKFSKCSKKMLSAIVMSLLLVEKDLYATVVRNERLMILDPHSSYKAYYSEIRSLSSEDFIRSYQGFCEAIWKMAAVFTQLLDANNIREIAKSFYEKNGMGSYPNDSVLFKLEEMMYV